MNQQKRLRRAKAKRRYNTLARHFGTSTPVENSIRLGNPDHGCPYKGKDRFSGMWKKFRTRMDIDEETGRIFCFVYDNNKYGQEY